MSDNENNMTRPDDADVTMTDTERALAAQIAEDRRTVAPFLNVPDARAAAAVARVRQRIAADVAPPQPVAVVLTPHRRATVGLASPRRTIRLGAWSAAAAAAVAAVLLTAVLWTTSNDPATNPDGPQIAANPGSPQHPADGNGSHYNGGATDLTDDLIATLLTDPLVLDSDADFLELLTTMAGELEPQYAAFEAQLVAAWLDS